MLESAGWKLLVNSVRMLCQGLKANKTNAELVLNQTIISYVFACVGELKNSTRRDSTAFRGRSLDGKRQCMELVFSCWNLLLVSSNDILSQNVWITSGLMPVGTRKTELI